MRAFVSITAPFGVTLDLADRHPWESLERCSQSFWVQELYFGFAYVAVGQVAPTEHHSACPLAGSGAG